MRRVPRLRAMLYCLALLAPACKGCRRDPATPRVAAPTASTDQPAVLARLPAGATSSPAPPPSAPEGSVHPMQPGEREFSFSERGGGVAYVEQVAGGAFVVHNGRAGKRYAAVGSLALSPDGRRVAYGALASGKWRLVVDEIEGPPFDAIEMALFSPDGAHVSYQAMAGERWHLVVDATVSGGTTTRYLGHAFAAGPRIVFIDDVDDSGQGRLVVSDLGFEKQTVVAARASSMTLDPGRTAVAAIAASGTQKQVITALVASPDSLRKGPLFDAVSGIVLGPGGASVAYVGERSGRRAVVLDGREGALPPGGQLTSALVLRPQGDGVGALFLAQDQVRFQEYFAPGAAGDGPWEAAEALVYSPDGAARAYAAAQGGREFVVVNGHRGPDFDRVVSPSFSPDGKVLVYRARQDGRRFVVVADLQGKTIRRHPAYDQVFPVLFTADGKSAAYGVKDGLELAWKVERL